MTKNEALSILGAIESKDYSMLESLRVRVYGNKGRSWSGTACITNLDTDKGQCNPRLAFNSCDVRDIGCPDCLETLKTIACV